MARTGWLGLPPLQTWWRSEATAPDALVLAGGGARASFQLGALRCLYAHTDFTARTIVGTSAGSILAAVLAQYATHDGQRDGVDQLEEIWRGLEQQSDMFAERRWFRQLRRLGPDLQELIPTPPENPDPHPVPSATGVVGRARGWFGASRRAEAEDEAPVGPDQHVHPLLGFQPEEDYGSSTHRLTDTWQLVGQLATTVSRASGELPAIWRGIERTRACYRPGPILRELLSPAVFDPERVRRSGITLRMSTVCLDTGQLRYLGQDGVLVDRNNEPIPDAPQHDLVMGVLASCSIPGVFAPVPLGDEHYVDGGVRENVPAELAMGHLGAKRPYVVVSSPGGVERQRSEGEGLLAILFRTSSIMSDELQRDELAYARSAGAVVIEPEVSVHDAMTVDPGLIAINIDYGWLRAMEHLAGADDATVKRHRDIVVARTRAWALENSLTGPEALTDPVERGDAARELELQRGTVRRLVALADSALLPAGYERWGRVPERHARLEDQSSPAGASAER